MLIVLIVATIATRQPNFGRCYCRNEFEMDGLLLVVVRKRLYAPSFFLFQQKIQSHH